MACRCDEQDSPAAYRQEADRMAMMLCNLCEYLERGQIEMENYSDHHPRFWQKDDLKNPCNMERWPTSVRKWWKDHKKKDEERKAKESADERKKELKTSALNKLTKEERLALGFPN